MPREIEARGLIFSLRHAPCAHICRYCLVSETRKGSKLPLARFERLLHRFYDWKDSGQTDISIRTFIGPSFDYDIDTLKGVARLRARRGNPFEIMNLGGLRMRDADALKVWLDERQAAGIVGFHTSLAGCDTVHDRWNGQAGDFDYQISILRMAGERGMVRQERLFLTQNTLPLFDRLLDIMEGIPGEVRSRIVTPFFYASLARRYEDQRLTEEIRDALPERIAKLRRGRFAEWRSRSASTARIIAACHHSKSSARATAIGRAARSICCPATWSRSGWTCTSRKPGPRFRWIERCASDCCDCSESFRRQTERSGGPATVAPLVPRIAHCQL
jgi:hypothetical protein